MLIPSTRQVYRTNRAHSMHIEWSYNWKINHYLLNASHSFVYEVLRIWPRISRTYIHIHTFDQFQFQLQRYFISVKLEFVVTVFFLFSHFLNFVFPFRGKWNWMFHIESLDCMHMCMFAYWPTVNHSSAFLYSIWQLVGFLYTMLIFIRVRLIINKWNYSSFYSKFIINLNFSFEFNQSVELVALQKFDESYPQHKFIDNFQISIIASKKENFWNANIQIALVVHSLNNQPQTDHFRYGTRFCRWSCAHY